MKFYFNGLLQNSKWLENVLVETNDRGIITSIEENTENIDFINNYAIPGFQNAHSHSFQYAMAGVAENHLSDNAQDDFWSWREVMYRLALSVTPEQIEAIATTLYVEMLRHGYTNVAEFHYLHHDKDGKSYQNRAELGLRLIRAAKTAGIGITIIPIFYQKGGFNKPAEANQRRFISDSIENYQKLYEATESACKYYEKANIGIGVHSMRGVEPELVIEVAENFPKSVPFHIHISEQLKEVADCVKFLGKRPVEWMLENIDLSDRFHFVHATHLNDKEIKGLAKSKVNVLLCPTTEGNLGDGIFPLKRFQDLGGKWCIGTDSHVSLDPFEELRLLDYGQRLVSRKRNTFADKTGDGGASYAIRQVTVSGRKAMNNFNSEYFAIGKPLDACVISGKHPLIQSTSIENLLNTIVYSMNKTIRKGTIVSGKWRIENGEHEKQKDINHKFIGALNKLEIR